MAYRLTPDVPSIATAKADIEAKMICLMSVISVAIRRTAGIDLKAGNGHF
jgi:hypothetical protein